MFVGEKTGVRRRGREVSTKEEGGCEEDVDCFEISVDDRGITRMEEAHACVGGEKDRIRRGKFRWMGVLCWSFFGLVLFLYEVYA